MEFKDRLKEYREELKINTQKDMAAKLKIARTLYSMLEKGTRQPSKDILEKLFILSGKPEEYWLYGVANKEEYLETREDFKCLKDAIKQLKEIGMLSLENKDFSKSVKDVLLAATLADVTHILEKENLENGKE